MTSQKFDVVIFGAYGVTGSMVMEMLAEVNKKGKKLRWAIAGRDEKKLRSSLEKVSNEAKFDASEVGEIVASTDDVTSLATMCKQAKVLINVTGPFNLYGDVVIQACLDNGCNYVDCSSESEFQEQALLRYGEVAKLKNLFVLVACGMYSLVPDLAVSYLKTKFEGEVNDIEMFTEINQKESDPILSLAAWKSYVMDRGESSKLQVLQSITKSIEGPPPIYPFERRNCITYCDYSQQWCVWENNSNTNSLKKSQKLLHIKNGEKYPLIRCFMLMPNFVFALFYLIFNSLIDLCTRWEFMQPLAIKYYRIFSFGMVTDSAPSSIGSVNYVLAAKGWGAQDQSPSSSTPPNKTKILKIHYPGSAYALTALSLVCATELLINKEALEISGGVFTPAYAFHHTNFVEILKEHGLLFELEDVKK